MNKLFSCLVKRPIGIFLRKLEKEKYNHDLRKARLEVPTKGIYLSYAGLSLPDADGILHGGRVKLMHLANVYPEEKSLVNILYLVSSAAPIHADVLIKHLKKKGVKIIWNQNGVAYPAWAGDSYEATNTRLSKLLHMSDFVVYQSDFCRLSADRYLGISNAPYKVLYNPVDTDEFVPSDVPPSLDTWQLLITGTHLQSERVLLILETLAELISRGQNAKLVIAGRLAWPNGDEETQAAIQHLKLGENIELIGAYTQNQAPGIYQAAHILLHIKYKDPCPTVPIEAMSCGVPVIGSLSGGMPELVSDEGGVLLDVPDHWDRMCYPHPDEMVEAVYKIMSDLYGWREKARQRAVCNFNKDYWLEQHCQIFLGIS